MKKVNSSQGLNGNPSPTDFGGISSQTKKPLQDRAILPALKESLGKNVVEQLRNIASAEQIRGFHHNPIGKIL